MARKVIVEIDLNDVQTADQLHELLSDRLDFPGWYGKNWDAFWDAITGLVEMPEKLKLVGWLSLEHRLPNEAALMKNSLDQMLQQLPELSPKVEYV